MSCSWRQGSRVVTKRERAQVVELLRCAADNVIAASCPSECALTISFRDLGFSWIAVYQSIAHRAETAIYEEQSLDSITSRYESALRISALLEAAARIEEGS